MNAMRSILRDIVDPIRDYPDVFMMIRNTFHPRRSVYQHLHFRGRIVVGVGEGAQFEINHYGYHVENELFWAGFGHGGYEALELRIWGALAQGADYIADVGANTGVYCLTAAALQPGAHIVAFEPVPRVYEKLCANIKLNPFNIQALQIAVSNFDGEATLFDTGGEHEYSASLDPTMLGNGSSSPLQVRTARLDRVLDELNWPRVDLLKVDVEKHEPAVLSGFERRLREDRPAILIEILSEEIGRAIASQIEGLGYRCFRIGGREGLAEAEGCWAGGEGRNYLLITEEAWRSVENRVRAAIE